MALVESPRFRNATARLEQLSRAQRCATSFSQKGEDQALIRYVLKGARNGSYLEIGALDGIRWSNTALLHFCYGWSRGLLVEADNATFTDLVSHVADHRSPGVVAMFGAVCAPPQSMVQFWEAANPDVSGSPSSMATVFRKRFHDTPGAQGRYNAPGKVYRRTSCPCSPMSEYIRQSQLPVVCEGERCWKHVDLFSLDVEGAE